MDLNRQLNPRFAFWSWVVWISVCVVAITLNGGLGNIRNPLSLWLATLLCASLVFFSAGTLKSSAIRRLVLRPDISIEEVRRELVLRSIIGSILFLFCVAALAVR